MKRLNLACGEVILKGWDNLDYEARTEGVIICNLTEKLPYEDNSVDEILTSHFLEHLKLRTEAIPFLQECERVLKPNGIFSIIVPDFEALNKVKMFDYHFNKFRSKKAQMRWLVGATFGEGRTQWDYHVSGWFEERFKEMGKLGYIKVDPAAGGKVDVWEKNNMKLKTLHKNWRPHSPYEITAIFQKDGINSMEPSWLDEPAVVGNSELKSCFKYTLGRLPLMIKKIFKK